MADQERVLTLESENDVELLTLPYGRRSRSKSKSNNFEKKTAMNVAGPELNQNEILVVQDSFNVEKEVDPEQQAKFRDRSNLRRSSDNIGMNRCSITLE